jgi:hypothetical protein
MGWGVKKHRYEVHSNPDKVYIESLSGCVARLCKVSGEFFYDPCQVIFNCSFKEFQRIALERGYIVKDHHRPEWDKEKCDDN